jgi:hypothetical protein
VRPSWSTVRQLAVCLVVAGAIGAWALRGTDRAVLAAAVADANLAVLAAATLGFVMLFSVIDVSGFLLAYRRHLDPAVPWRDVAVVVCGKQLLGLVNPLLTKTVALTYFRRRGVDVLTTLGASELVSIADTTAVFVFVTVAAVGTGLALPGAVQVVLALWWVGVAWQVVWRSPALAGTRRAVAPRGRLFAAFNRAGPGELGAQVGLRIVLGAGTLAFVRVVLGDLGPALGPAQLLAFGALLMFTTQLPFSIGGFGGPQGAAVLLLSHTWHVASDEQAAAFSLVWSTLLLVGRFALSAPFALALARLLRSAPPTPPPPPPPPAPALAATAAGPPTEAVP